MNRTFDRIIDAAINVDQAAAEVQHGSNRALKQLQTEQGCTFPSWRCPCGYSAQGRTCGRCGTDLIHRVGTDASTDHDPR